MSDLNKFIKIISKNNRDFSVSPCDAKCDEPRYHWIKVKMTSGDNSAYFYFDKDRGDVFSHFNIREANERD